MKKIAIISFTLASVALLTFLGACDKKSEKFSVQKLQLRQEIDEAILRIDEQLESLQKDSMPADTLSDRTEGQIANLKELRNDLNQTLDELVDVSESEWVAFEDNARGKLEEIRVTLDRIRIDETPIERYPTTS